MSCQLLMLNNGKWGANSKKTRYFRDPNGSIIGSTPNFEEAFMNRTLEECAEFLMQRGVENDEIDHAVEAMLKNEHNLAEFGALGGFVFSKYIGWVH